MITTQLRNLLLAVVCIFAGVQAHAQFTGSAEQYPTTDYSAKPIEFSLAEVATALGSDAATLGAAISEYTNAETPATLLFSANGTEWTAELEAANHGFWMALDGTPVGYGETSMWYCSPEVDEAFTTLTFNVGQMPEKMKEGDKGETTIKLKFNEKEVTFALTLNVIAKPEFNVPEPTILASKLTIVGQEEKVIEQFPRGDYSSDVVRIDIANALSLLGITNKAGFAENVGKVIYTTWYNSGDVAEGGGMKKDSLTNAPTGEGHGFWFRAVQNAEGQEDGEVSAAGWGDVDKFYLNSFTYTAEDDTLQCYLGQYPGSCKDNETWFANVYLIYGSNAYLIKYTLKVLEKAQGNGLADYTKVGEASYETSQEPTTDYSTTQVKIDVEAIAAALGCEVSALGAIVLDDKDNFGGSTANNGGWWLSKLGRVTSWGTGAAFFIEPLTANDWSVINVGQYPEALTIGDEVSVDLNFVNGTNYYPVTVTLKVKEAELVEYNFESVDTRNFALQAVPSASDYPLGVLATIPVETIESLIGTTDPTLYGTPVDSLISVNGKYSNKYSCDPKPGFWLAKDGTVHKWDGENSPVGICYANGEFSFFQLPGVNNIGDVFKTTLYLVNEENNKMITVNFTLNFVETLEQKEEVGSENIVIPVAETEQATAIDLTKAAEALGTTVADLLDSNNYYLRGMAAGAYGEGKNCENGLSFASNGEYDGTGNLWFYLAADGDKVTLNSGSNDPVADDFNVKAQFCFEKDNKQYVFYATLASPAWIASGIESVKTAGNAATIYDLQGRKVVKAQRGLYIQNGRKFIVK